MLVNFGGSRNVASRKMEENVWSQPEIFSLLNKEYVIISLYVDDRELLPDVDQFNYKYPNGRVKSIKTIGEKWATFQSLNFGSASQPFYLLLSSNGTLLNSSVQYTNAQIYKDWLEEGIRRFKSLP